MSGDANFLEMPFFSRRLWFFLLPFVSRIQPIMTIFGRLIGFSWPLFVIAGRV